MRELKFRILTTENKWEYFDLYYGESWACDLVSGYCKRETLGEWTGLKDKNGKEIYESDLIINVSRNNGKPHEVIYRNGMFVGKYGSLLYPLWHDLDEIEVIGSVYENPELLKGKET